MTEKIGFVGIGAMGEPMAFNLLQNGIPLVIWNRTKSKCLPLQKAGAKIASSLDDLFLKTKTIILMLFNSEAIDNTLERGSSNFSSLVKGKLLINMGTTQPHYSEHLRSDVEEAGGNYIECPVSGSKRQAESRELVAMMAGEAALFPAITPLIETMCKTVVPCGKIPGALNMKLAVNLYLLNMVTGLAEAYHFAEEKQLDTEKFVQVLNASPMASTVSKIKLDKILTRDFSKQAAIIDVLAVANLIKEGLDETGLESPLARTSHALYQEAVDMGYGELDMIGIIELLRAKNAKKAKSLAEV